MSSSTDNISAGKPKQTTGQFNSVKGTVTEAIGDLTGSTNLQQTGNKEHAAGEAETTSAQNKTYVEGAKDRVIGAKDSVLGAVTGNKQEQLSGDAQQNVGTTKQAVSK